MKLIVVLALAATAVCTTTSTRLPAGVQYTQISPADIPDSIVLAEPPFNETALSDLDARDHDLSKRANHGVYLCVDAYFKGYCVHITSPADVCVPLASDLNDKVSSVGPDTGGYCRFYFNAGCTDNDGCLHFDSTNPGRSNLDLADQKVCGRNNPNDQITSYKC
ncbi:hypothetical protein LA080_015075 [Diaporthe eres]|uniref:Uncharacterized protein n=1 Tax=Diaporthe vaccinii TaxID=105482 RepID=A0ABR4F2P6_9PEZI|nr:hypothetical protein LA080_015075 [Diaporthe eres]